MNDTLKLGTVGFGRIVELVHLPLLKQLPQLEVTGIFDITPQRLSLAAKRGFTPYSELEQLLDSSIDAVLIATPPNSHYQIAEQALRKGKHVIIEKPVTLTAKESIQLKCIAEQEGKIVTIFQNRRFDNDYLLVKNMIEEEALGRIMFVERRHHMFGSGASFGVKSFNPGWRNQKSYGGGALLDWGVHLVDQLLQLGLGQCVEMRSCMRSLWSSQEEVDEYVHASIGTDQNVLLSMDINFASSVSAPLWIVGGEKATLQVISDKEAVIHRPGEQPAEVQMLDSKDGPLRIYSSFANAVLHGGDLEVTIDEAIETMKILDRIRDCAMLSEGAADGNLIYSSTI